MEGFACAALAFPMGCEEGTLVTKGGQCSARSESTHFCHTSIRWLLYFFFPFIYLVWIFYSIFSFLLWFSLLFKCFNPHQQLNSFRFGPVYRLWQSIPAPYHPNTMSAHNTRSSLLWATQLALNALAFSCLSNGTAFFLCHCGMAKKIFLRY